VALTQVFGSHRLGAGTKIIVSLVKAQTVGKAYVFRMHNGAHPTTSVRCVPAGANKPGGTC
jgi:hypothetical protein